MYFEVEILSGGYNDDVTIGVTSVKTLQIKQKVVGTYQNSVGINSKNGKFLLGG